MDLALVFLGSKEQLVLLLVQHVITELAHFLLQELQHFVLVQLDSEEQIVRSNVRDMDISAHLSPNVFVSQGTGELGATRLVLVEDWLAIKRQEHVLVHQAVEDWFAATMELVQCQQGSVNVIKGTL